MDGSSYAGIRTFSGPLNPWTQTGLPNSVILHFRSHTYGVYRGWNLTWSRELFLQ